MAIKIDCLVVLGEHQSDNEKNIDGGKPMLLSGKCNGTGGERWG